MCDLHSRFEEDRIKTTVAIGVERYCGQTDRWTHKNRPTYIQVILYLFNAMQCIGEWIVLAHLLTTIDTKFYQNRLGFVKDMIICWCVFRITA